MTSQSSRVPLYMEEGQRGIMEPVRNMGLAASRARAVAAYLRECSMMKMVGQLPLRGMPVQSPALSTRTASAAGFPASPGFLIEDFDLVRNVRELATKYVQHADAQQAESPLIAEQCNQIAQRLFAIAKTDRPGYIAAKMLAEEPLPGAFAPTRFAVRDLPPQAATANRNAAVDHMVAAKCLGVKPCMVDAIKKESKEPQRSAHVSGISFSPTPSDLQGWANWLIIEGDRALPSLPQAATAHYQMAEILAYLAANPDRLSPRVTDLAHFSGMAVADRSAPYPTQEVVAAGASPVLPAPHAPTAQYSAGLTCGACTMAAPAYPGCSGAGEGITIGRCLNCGGAW